MNDPGGALEDGRPYASDTEGHDNADSAPKVLGIPDRVRISSCMGGHPVLLTDAMRVPMQWSWLCAGMMTVIDGITGFVSLRNSRHSDRGIVDQETLEALQHMRHVEGTIDVRFTTHPEVVCILRVLQ